MSDNELYEYELGRGWEDLYGNDYDEYERRADDIDINAEEKQRRGMGIDSYDAMHVGEPWTPEQALAESLRMVVSLGANYVKQLGPKKDDQEQLCAFYECQSHFSRLNMNNDLVYVHVDGCSKYLPEPCRCPGYFSSAAAPGKPRHSRKCFFPTKECRYRFLGYCYFIRKDDVWILGSKVLYFKDEEAHNEYVHSLSLNLLSCSESPLDDFHKVEKKYTMIKSAAKR
jgi:hypothetical protein